LPNIRIIYHDEVGSKGKSTLIQK